jgi:hypothetical protein
MEMSEARWRKLKVWFLEQPADIYRDMARVNQDSRGRRVKEGRVYRVRVKSGKSLLLAIRGLADHGVLSIDEITRRKLGLKTGEEFEIAFERVGFWGNLIWSINASDPATRTAAQLGVLSLFLGVVSLALGVLAFLPENERANWLAALARASAAIGNAVSKLIH